MEINAVHEAFLGDWLVCFLYQTVLPHARHEGKSIHDKFTKAYTATCNKQAEAATGSTITYS